MLTSVESYLRRGQRWMQKWLVHPWVRTAGMVLLSGGGGFLLAAGSLLRYAQPLAMGCICALTGWPAVAMSLGAMGGYWVFWGVAGFQGTVWSAAGGLLAVLLGRQLRTGEQPLVIPSIAAFLTAITGLAFQILLADTTPVSIYLLRIAMAFFTAVVFTQAAQRRSAVTDWLAGGIGALALAQVMPIPYLGLGYLAAGTMAVTGALPGAVLAGLGLDLAQVTRVPMTAVLGLAWLARMIPLERRWLRYFLPGAACAAVMAVSGLWDPAPLPGLVLGGWLGYVLPPRPEAIPRRGETGFAQVRLELGAEVMGLTRQLLTEGTSPPIDEAAILQKARQRACGSCSYRKSCPEQAELSAFHLEHPLEVDCRKQGRLIPELRRGQEQLKLLKADRRRQEEYRAALVQQYEFLGDYLRTLADSLPRRGQRPRVCFRVEAAARSCGKERANGDRCLAFAGSDCRYYVLLCDGMGTGLGAAREGQSAAQLLRQLLTAGFPANHALRTVNSLLALQGSAGAVTVDLAELYLDTGYACVYKWGAAPSWLLRRTGNEKIGTATPPPGLSVADGREIVEKLSLRRGEALVLLSDGVDGEESLRQLGLATEGPPGELAAKILRGGRGTQDDATAVVIRLRPVSLST